MEEKILSELKKNWDRLLKEGQELAFRKGQVLAYEGHVPYGLFVLRSGRLQFTKGGIPCSSNHLWRAPEGEVVGLDPCFSQSPFCCTCTAVKDCQVTFVSKTQLEPLLP